MKTPRYRCPECGRAIAAIPFGGQVVYTATAGGRHHRYVYLRRHHRPPGVTCPGMTAPHIDMRLDKEIT